MIAAAGLTLAQSRALLASKPARPQVPTSGGER